MTCKKFNRPFVIVLHVINVLYTFWAKMILVGNKRAYTCIKIRKTVNFEPYMYISKVAMAAEK